MADYGATDRVRKTAADLYVRPAREQNQQKLQIHSGKFEKSLVESGILQRNRFPIVCNALRSRKFLLENRLELLDVQAPPSGQSSTVTYTYRLLPNPSGTNGQRVADKPALLKLRGALSETYKKLGGAERFHRTQRLEFER